MLLESCHLDNVTIDECLSKCVGFKRKSCKLTLCKVVDPFGVWKHGIPNPVPIRSIQDAVVSSSVQGGMQDESILSITPFEKGSSAVSRTSVHGNS